MTLSINKSTFVYILYAIFLLADTIFYIFCDISIFAGSILFGTKTLFAIYYYFKGDNKKLDFIRNLFLIDLFIILGILSILFVIYFVKEFIS